MATVGTLSTTVRVEVLECASCGTPFGVSERLLELRRVDSQNFWCPLGHINVFRDSEVARLKRELEKEKMKVSTAQRELEYERNKAARAERSLRAKKAQLTRLQNRIAKGFCPCCKKHFVEIYEHIATEHPEYVREHPEAVAKVKIKGLLPPHVDEKESD